MPTVLVLGYLAHVAWRLWLARDIVTPAAHADEDGYLVAARVLAGGEGGYSTENNAFRRTGYPALLVPIYWFTSDAFQVYRGMQLVNALVGSLVFPLSFLFARRVLDAPLRWALGAAFAAAALPAVAFYSPFAMTDAVFPTFGLGWLLLVYGLAVGRSRQVVYALGAGLMAGYMYTIHVRGTMLVLVHLLALTALVLTRRVTVRLAALSVVALAGAASLDWVFKYVLGDSIVLLGRSPKPQAVTAVTTFSGIAHALSKALGQVWYLTIGTWGLGAVGVAAVVWSLLRRAEVPPASDARLSFIRKLAAQVRRRMADPVAGGRLFVLAVVLVSTLLVAGGSAASLPLNDNRINYFAYPRYIHFLFPVWFLVGLLAVYRRPRREFTRLVAAGAAGVLLTAAVVWLNINLKRKGTYYLFLGFDAPEASFLSWHWQVIQVLLPTVAALALLAVLVAAQRRFRATIAVLAGLALLNAVAMHFIVERVSLPMVVNQYLPATPRLVSDLHIGPGDVVAEKWHTPWPWVYNHMREVYWQRIKVFETESPPADATVVIAPWRPDHADTTRHWDGTQYGLRRVATDEEHYWAVWRRN